MIRYGTVAQMIAYLDREAIAAARERRFRNNLRRLKSAKQRKFVLALVRVMLHERGPEICIRKKVTSRRKIGIRAYEKYLKICSQTIAKCPLCGGM